MDPGLPPVQRKRTVSYRKKNVKRKHNFSFHRRERSETLAGPYLSEVSTSLHCPPLSAFRRWCCSDEHSRCPSFPVTVMNPECHQKHSSTLSIAIPLQSRGYVCVPCLQADVRRQNLICTLRRAAATCLGEIALAPEHLLRRAPHYAGELLIDLLSSLFAISPREYALAADIRQTVSRLAFAFDAITERRGCSMFQLVSQRIIDEILCVDCAARAKQPVLQLGECLHAIRMDVRVIRDDVLMVLRRVIHGRAEQTILSILRVIVGEDELYGPATEVICAILGAASHEEVALESVVNAVAGVMPSRRVTDAGAFFLRVVHALSTRPVVHSLNLGGSNMELASILIKCETFTDVLKQALLADDPVERSLATKIICLFCEESSQIAEQFCTCGVFEYIIESVRALDEADNYSKLDLTEALVLAIEALVTIVDHNPSQLVQKWCYSLPVVMSVSGRLIEHTHAKRIARIAGNAFRYAPLPVFTSRMIKQFTDFLMMICSRTNDVRTRESTGKALENPVGYIHQYNVILTEGVNHLVELCKRYKFDLECMQNLLKICEASVWHSRRLACVFALLEAVAKQIQARLSNDDEEPVHSSNEWKFVADKLLFVVFDSWAEVFEGTFDKLAVGAETAWSYETFFATMKMFTATLDVCCATNNVCSFQDQEGMKFWCWKFFPPAIVLSYSKLFLERDDKGFIGEHDDEKCQEVVQNYLLIISSTPPILSAATSVNITEDSLLAGLAGDITELHELSFVLLERALEMDLVAHLCAPEKISEALSSRLQRFAVCTAQRMPNVHFLVVRGLCVICSQHGIELCSQGPRKADLLQALHHERFSVDDPKIFPMFREMVLREEPDEVTTLLWDKFASSYQLRENACGVVTPNVWELLGQQRGLFRGIGYALIHSSSPECLTECLWDLFDGRGLLEVLCRSIEEAGGLNDVRKALSELGHHSPVGTSSLTSEEQKKIQTQRSRVSCCLLLLSQNRKGTPSIDWALLHDLCDILIKDFIMVGRVGRVEREDYGFGTSILRYLISSTRNTMEEKVCLYMWQVGIPQHLTVFLQLAREESFAADQLISASACLLLLMLKKRHQYIGGDPLLPVLAELLQDVEAWERLLCSSHLAREEHCSLKATNSCHLFCFLLLIPALRRAITKLFSASYMVILLTRAACSNSELLREVAFKALAICMELESFQFSKQISFCLHEQLSVDRFEQLCIKNAEVIGAWDIRYLTAATFCGHLDDQLSILSNSAKKWSHVLTTQQADRCAAEVKAAGTTIEVGTLLRTVQEREIIVDKLKRSPPVLRFVAKQRHCKKKQARASDRDMTFELIVRRYVVAWQEHGHKVFISSSSRK